MSLLPKASLAILAGLGLAAAHPANAQVLYKQSYDGVSSAAPSQVLSDIPLLTSYSLDDFTVTGTGWDISKVTAFGKDTGNLNANSAVSLAFTTEPNASAVPDVSAITSTNTYTGAENASHNLVFTQSIPIHLNPGSYFITAFVTRDSSGGRWLFDETTPVHGQDFYVSNPGSGVGGGKTSYHPDAGHDLAFEIEGTPSPGVPPAVPEPSSVLTFAVAALGIGGLMIAAKRKKSTSRLPSSLSSSL